MKKTLQSALALLCLGLLPILTSAQRYTSEIFTSVNRFNDIVYGSNISILPPAGLKDLKMDVYTPDSLQDNLTERPLVIVMHTGSFLPPVINGSPTGSKTDSAVVEICAQFARRGYVAAAMTYRQGWNPQATDVDVRTGTLLQAVYRGLQDAKACVRYFRANATVGGNTYGIDTSKIILGGIGTGGYIALAYATLNDTSEIWLPKFISGTNNPTYGLVAGQSYVNQAALGDFDGYGGIPQLNNPNNSPGYSTDVQFVFNMGGALGDSSWMGAGDAPMVAFHVVGDPFAPYDTGIVVVPTTGDFVVEVAGSYLALRRANTLGNNNCFANAGISDVYTTAANTFNDGYEGLYPFVTDPFAQAGPWEWFDSLAVVTYASFLPPPYNGAGPIVYSSALWTNPDMSKAKALAYIDTVMGYLNPRMAYCLNLTSGIQGTGVADAGLQFVPNPAHDKVAVSSSLNMIIRSVNVFDLTGKRVLTIEGNNQTSLTLERNGLDAGVYMIQVNTENGVRTGRIIFQ